MRRFISLLSVVSLFIVSMVMSISAQEATPPAEEMGPPDSFELAPGVMADKMVFADGAMDPVSARLTFEPGVVYEVIPGPNLEVVYMESGTLTMTLDGAVVVTGLGDAESGGKIFAAGTQITLEEGHFFVIQPGVAGEVRNDSSEPASISVAGLTPAGGASASPEASPEG